ncbi:hypothetical protein [Mycobacterium sp.]|uniref:hypothetical protein n=1 Tax=Mycobacterium sp. TaxID=1785 RepID=UPI003341676C
MLLGIGVLLLQFAFILSYLGALHSPSPHRIPVTVVAPSQVAGQIVDQLNSVAGQPVTPTASTDEQAAREALRTGETSGVYLVSTTGDGDSVLIASGGGTAVATAVEQLFTTAAQLHDRTVTVEDVCRSSRGMPAACPASTSSSAGQSAAICSRPCSASPRARVRPPCRAQCGGSARPCHTPWRPASAAPRSPDQGCTR